MTRSSPAARVMSREVREAPPPGEERRDRASPLLRVHRDWERRFPGLRIGITGPGEDFGLEGSGSAWAVAERYEALGRRLGFPAVAVGRQVHGTEVAVVDRAPTRGFLIAGATDGLTTNRRGVLLAVTAADCVPVYLVAPERKSAALLHGGWRGTASGILAAGLGRLGDRYGVDPGELWMHLGPAVCGDCYEVGPEVLEALGRSTGGSSGSPRMTGHVDLRTELAERALAAGVDPERVSVSGWCTVCEPDLFHSYRGRGETTGRMAAFLGWK